MPVSHNYIVRQCESLPSMDSSNDASPHHQVQGQARTIDKNKTVSRSQPTSHMVIQQTLNLKPPCQHLIQLGRKVHDLLCETRIPLPLANPRRGNSSRSGGTEDMVDKGNCSCIYFSRPSGTFIYLSVCLKISFLLVFRTYMYSWDLITAIYRSIDPSTHHLKHKSTQEQIPPHTT